MKKLSILLPIVTLSLLFSCKKSSTASGSSTPGVEFQLNTTNRSSAVNRTDAAGSITWTSGYASATEIKMEAKDANSVQVEYKSNVKQKIDLFTGVAGVLGNVTLAPGFYSEVEFRIETAPSGSDAALQLNGSFKNGNTGSVTAVTFQINDPFEIKGEKNNVVIANSTTTTALTTLDLSSLTSGISQAILANATVTGGTIVISSTSNVPLYNIIITNLHLRHEAEIGHH